MGLFKKWQPKTKFGKIMKGVTIGSVGVAGIATGVGAVAGAVGGVGLFAGAAKGVGTLVKAVGGGTKVIGSKISASAVKLLTGQSKEENAIIKEVKDQAKAAAQSNDAVSKLMKLGLSEGEARAKLGLSQLSDDKQPDTDDLGFWGKLISGENKIASDVNASAPLPKDNKMLIYGGLGMLGLLFLPKILK